MKQEPRVLVCGEALMDVYRGAEPDARVGGSPFNVAIGASRLGLSVAYFGSISRDAYGAQLLAELDREGVDTRAVPRTDAPTTLSIVGVDADGSPTYTFQGERGADRQLLLDSIAQIPPSIAAVHVGSYPMVVEPVATTLRALVESRHRTAFIAWDPNVRLNVVPELERWRELLDWMLGRTHMLKLSAEDLAVLAPDVAAADFAARALSRGVGLVVLTEGAEGATAWSNSGAIMHVVAPHVDVVDTVGAGDAFQAALLTWLGERGRLTHDGVGSLGDQPMEDLLTFAARAAATTCARRGAVLPRREDWVA
jgi:fructokinase